MKKRKLAEIDFQPRSSIPKLLIFLWLYVFTLGWFLFTKVLHASGNNAPSWTPLVNMFIVCGYFLGAALLLFYAVFNVRRFAFTDEGVRVLTWRGNQFFKWSEINQAYLTDLKRTVDMVLRVGKRSYIIIPLNSFVRSETLFYEIRQRLDVYVWTTETQMNKITEVKNTFPPV